jgi:zinc/manganese transport system permease protein
LVPEERRMSPYDAIIAPFADYAFMRRALAGCVALSFGAAPIGVLMMLRRMSLVGDAMAHAILPGAAVGFLLFGLKVVPMTVGGLAAGLFVALAAGLVARTTVQREDASLAAFYLISLALGVMIVSMKGSNVDLMHVLFGTVLALDNTALTVLGIAASVNLIGLAIILRSLVAECVDPSFLSVVGRSGGAAHLAFLVMAVLGLVAGFQALGTLLSVGMMMLPAAASRFWARSLEGMMGLAVIGGIAASVVGLLVSFHFSAPSGPAITLAAGVFYLFSLIIGPVSGAIWNVLPQRHRTG